MSPIEPAPGAPQLEPLGIVIVTHGQLALEFVAAWEHVVGTQSGVATVCIGPEDDMDQRRAEIRQAVTDTDAGRGVIILTDMFGGTPSNLAISIMRPGVVEVVAGVNLPMLIKIAKVRSTLGAAAAAALAQEAGRKYITVASQLVER